MNYLILAVNWNLKFLDFAPCPKHAAVLELHHNQVVFDYLIRLFNSAYSIPLFLNNPEYPELSEGFDRRTLNMILKCNMCDFENAA